MRTTRWTVITISVLLSAAAQAVGVIPPSPVYAVTGVYPDVPTSSEAITIVVNDRYLGTTLGGLAASRNVSARVEGNVIYVTAELIDPEGVSQPPISVTIPALPEGRYRVSYDGSAGLPNPERHRAVSDFSVSNTGYVTVVEYYNAALDHYFITPIPDEIAKLDAGIIKGWARTGESFRAIRPETAPEGAGPVCRMYGRPEFGIDSHFFADQGYGLQECSVVLQKWPDQWILESLNVFSTSRSLRPNTSLTTCGDDGQPLYRLYNNRPDANHRYTVSRQTRDQMLSQGWILEGPTYDFMPLVPGDVRQIAMCVLK